MKCNQSLHCQYHQKRGHNIEDCKTLWNHLEQLARDGKLKQFLQQPGRQNGQVGSRSQRDTSLRPPLGKIIVILAALGRTSSHPSRVMFVARLLAKETNFEQKRARVEIQPTLSFSNEDKIGTIQPHNDALVVTLII